MKREYAIGAFATILGVNVVCFSADNPRRTDDCGAVCLYIALRSLDVPVDGLEEINSRIGDPPEGGYSLAQLASIAESYGLRTRGVETTTGNLLHRPGRFACIAHYTEGHFVNLINVEKGQVHLIDTSHSMRVPIETFDSIWSRNALLISHDPIMAESDLPVPWNWMRIALIGLAIVILATAIVFIPRYMKR